MQARTTTTDDGNDATYYCIKCDRNHRRSSGIGCWHEGIEIPELEESSWGKAQSRPEPEHVAAAIAYELERKDDDTNTTYFGGVSERDVRDRWEREGFDERWSDDPIDLLHELTDTHRCLMFQRSGGKNWIAWTVNTNNHLRLKNVASEYRIRGKASFKHSREFKQSQSN